MMYYLWHYLLLNLYYLAHVHYDVLYSRNNPSKMNSREIDLDEIVTIDEDLIIDKVLKESQARLKIFGPQITKLYERDPPEVDLLFKI